MYFLILEDSGGLICWVHSYYSCHLLIYISITSICIAWFMFCEHCGIYRISSIFLRFNLCILWNPWNPYYLLGILSHLCVQVSGCWLQERERGIIISYLFAFCFGNKLIHLLIHSSPLYIWFGIQFFDLRFVIWSGFLKYLHLNPQYIVQSSDFLNIFEDFILEYC